MNCVTLAVGNSFAEITAAIANLFSQVDGLAHPAEMVHKLQQLPIVLAGVFIAVGLVCMLEGFKLYRWVVIAIAAVTGLVIGYQLGQAVQAEVIVAVCLGVLLGVVAWPLMKYAVAVAGGVAGAFIGANAWTAGAIILQKSGHAWANPSTAWAGALMGLVILGLSSFILFEVSVLLFTSISGSVLAVMGILALLLQVPTFQQSLASGLSNPVIMPMLVIVPAVIGLVFQHHQGALKATKRPPAPGGAKAPSGAQPKPA